MEKDMKTSIQVSLEVIGRRLEKIIIQIDLSRKSLKLLVIHRYINKL